MTAIFNYKFSDTPNYGHLTKGPLDTPSYRINYSGGMTSGLTLGSCGISSLGSDGNSADSRIVDSVSVSGKVATVKLKTGGSSGTGSATDRDRFEVKVTAHLSNGQNLPFYTYIYIEAPTYAPV